MTKSSTKPAPESDAYYDAISDLVDQRPIGYVGRIVCPQEAALRKRVSKLADKAAKSHDLAMRSYDRYMRVQGGTTTSNRHFDRYVRNDEAFDAAIAELKKLAD